MQQVEADRQGGRKIKQAAPTAVAHSVDHGHGFSCGDFHLKDEERARTKQLVRHLVGMHARIGARGDRDRVLPGGGNHDRGTAGGFRNASHQPEIDPRTPQRVECGGGKGIRPNGSDQMDLGSGTARGQRLISALSPGKNRVVAAEHGLARPRQMRNRKDQIDIDRAEDDNHRTMSVPGQAGTLS